MRQLCLVGSTINSPIKVPCKKLCELHIFLFRFNNFFSLDTVCHFLKHLFLLIWGYLLCGPSLKGNLSQFGRALSVVGNFPPYWIVQSTHNNKFQFVVVPGFFKSLLFT